MNWSRYICISAVFFLLAVSVKLQAQAWKTYPHTPSGSLISFPVDEGWHPDEEIEWWYVAGHLEGTTSGTAYSFMLTYFYYPGDTFGISYEGFRILNLGKDDSGEFHTETIPVLRYINLDTSQLHIDAQLYNGVDEFWYHKKDIDGELIPFEYELSANAANGSIALSLYSQKRPLIPGDDGLFNQGASSYTYYYSLTDVRVEGSFEYEGSSEAVTGSAWIDRQYGNFNPNTGEAYEWFYLQLSNGMDYNIWNLFTPQQRLPNDPAYRHLSAYVDEDTQFTSHDFELDRLSWARMPGTETCYAQRWQLRSETNQLDLTITTMHHNSEVQLPFNFFEGPITVSGYVNGTSVTGIGFAELIKTYEVPEIEIVRPRKRWNQDFPIAWKLENPDDGRPLLYDLAYSTDHGNSWISISEGISDTLYYWNNHPFVNGDSCLFRVEGYTADQILSGVYDASVYTHYDDQYTHAELVAAQAFTINPNPVENTLLIEGRDGSVALGDQITFLIVDNTGRSLIKGSLTGKEIDVSSLKSGIYLILLRSLNEVFVHKFLKE